MAESERARAAEEAALRERAADEYARRVDKFELPSDYIECDAFEDGAWWGWMARASEPVVEASRDEYVAAHTAYAHSLCAESPGEYAKMLRVRTSEQHDIALRAAIEAALAERETP